MLKITAIAVSEGLAKAKAFVLRAADLSVEKKIICDTDFEKQRAAVAVDKAIAQLDELIQTTTETLGAQNAEIFEAHQMMLSDPDFLEGIETVVEEQKVCAEYATEQTAEKLKAVFRAMDSEYMQARAADIGDIAGRVIKILKGIEGNSLDSIHEPCIVIASDLTPSDTAKIGTKPVQGFVTQAGGKTSHSAIMARSMGIPAVAGIGEAAEQIRSGDTILLDGCTGEVIVNPDEETEHEFNRKKATFDTQRRLLEVYLDKKGATADGHEILIEGNIGSPKDADAVVAVGGEGIGLFRSEFLFMDRDDLPGEEEQFLAYQAVAKKLAGKPVIIRTLDIGGDKAVPALALEKEENPFLGYRAIRICLDREELFLTQLRALLRASAFGSIRIMFPMISSLEEICRAKAVVKKAMEQLDSEGIEYDSKIKIGIMIEIPAAAICADILAKEVDFFSIGTNDLIQYTCAVDRVNDKISALYKPLHPGVLRLIKMTADAGRAAGIEVGVCGEMAGSRGMASVLCGLGVTNLSMSASSILGAKSDLDHHTLEECRLLADSLLRAPSAEHGERIFAENHLKKADL